MTFSVTPNNNGSSLLNSLLGSVSGLSNFSVNVIGSAEAFGVFENDPFGFGSGVVLSTGRVADLAGQNNNFTDLDTDLPDNDSITLEISFDADSTPNKLLFEYVFGSEEFPEYGGGGFNDTFELLLNGVNLAKLSNGLPVTINNLVPNPNGPYHPDYINNPPGSSTQTKLDGFTKVLQFEGVVTPNARNTLTFNIKDVGDSKYDSAVFINGDSIRTVVPDLAVTNITTPQEGFSGQNIEIAWTVTNQGNLDATGTWTDYVYLSDDPQVGGDLLYGPFSFTGTIAAGASIERKQSIKLPEGVSGQRWVIVKTDGNNQIYEGAKESNNTLVDDNSFTLRLSPFPNLQVESVTTPPSAFSSQQATVQWKVINTGTAGTSTPFWIDSVWLSLDNTFDNTDTFLGSIANPSYLNVGESYTNSLTVNLPRGIDGNYYFLVKTDVDNKVIEFNNENDNFGAGGPTNVQLTPPPDLLVTNVNAPTQAFSGQSLTLSWTVTNSGTGRNLETSWYDDIFMSVDEILDDGDRFLGRRFQSGIFNPGTSYNATYTVTPPVDVSGDFFFFVRTDAGNQVYENAFEGNNTGYDATATRVNLTPPPDLEVEFVDAPALASASRPLTINYKVTNFGATATPNSAWTDTFYLSADAQLNLDTDLKLGTQSHFGTLDAGASYDGSATFVLPDSIQGSYYAFVVTDSANNVFELNKGNNIAFDGNPIPITSRPADLVVTANIPATTEAGKAFWMDWTVTNQGIGDTAVTNWTDRVIASKDTVLGNGDDVYLAEFEHSGLLNPNSFYQRNELVTIPFELVGQYNLFVTTDTNGRVYEATNEANNSVFQAVNIVRQTPDLQVTQVSAPTTANSGQPFTVNWTVRNFGAGRTNTDYWYDDIYLSTDSFISSNDIRLGRVYRSGVLEPSAQYNASETFNLPIDTVGQFYTLVRTDSTERVLEAPLDNNNERATSSPATIALGAVPDMIIDSVDAPATAISGQPLNLTWTVRNTGGAATGNRSWYDAFYLSRDQFFDRNTDTYLGFKPLSLDLAAGASYTQSESFTIPQGLSGPFYVFAVTDSGNNINERNGEQNNVGYDSISTQVDLPLPADLVVTDISIPASGVPGQNATISYTVTNQGANPARGSWSDAIYLSKDNQWDVEDALIGRVEHSGDVPSGGNYSETLTAPLPGVVSGDYRVIVRSDIRNQISESEENNNTQASVQQVPLAPEELLLGIPDTDTLAQGQSVFYRVNVPAGETLQIDFDSNSATAFNEVYVSFGEVPTRANFDVAASEPFSADQRILIPSTEAGTYFIRAFGNNVPSEPASYNISAKLAEFSVFNESYGRGGNAGNLTIEVDGAKFDRSVTVRLTDGAGVSRPAAKVYHIDTTKAFATFDLTGLTPGNYNVVVENADGDSITVSDGLEVVSGGGGNNRPIVDAPSRIRRNSNFNYTALWGNNGINDAEAPLLVVSNDTVPFGFSPNDFSAGRQYTFLGTTDEGPAGILRPGQSASLTFFSTSENQTGTYEVAVDRPFDDLTQPFDFETIRSNLIPADMSEAEFQPIFDQLIAQIGPTQGDYLQMLSRNATLLPSELGNNRLETDLLQLELTKAIAAVGTSIGGKVFARSFDVDLSGIEVRAENTTTGELFTSLTLNDGSFIFEDLTPGSYSFAVPSALIQEASPITVDLQEGQALTDLTINLEAGASIFGGVTKAVTGSSVANASVLLFSGDELVNTTVTDEKGQYVFNTLAPGSYTVMIDSEELARTWTSNLVVTDNDLRVDVPLAEDASVTGTVTLADGQPARDVLVIASLQSDNPLPIFSNISESGNFSLGSLGTGVYDITVFRQGYEPFTLEGVNIAAGEAINLGTIELGVESGIAPSATNNADAFVSANSASLLQATQSDLPGLNIAQLALLEQQGRNIVFTLIRKNNMGRQVEEIARKYFDSEGPVDRVELFTDSFEDDPTTQDAIREIIRKFADAISANPSRLFKLKDAIDNFKCGQKPAIIPYDIEYLRERLGLSEFLTFVQGNENERNDRPELKAAKDRWKYQGANTIPGLLAGGVGLGGPPPFDYPPLLPGLPPSKAVPKIFDYRRVSGNFNIVIDGSGSATIQTDLKVEIGDTFDFNPGGLGNDPLTAAVVAGLGTLEFYGEAYDVPFINRFSDDRRIVPLSLNIPKAGKCGNNQGNGGGNGRGKVDDKKQINVPASLDPNDILGPQGFGEEHWVAAADPLAYTIRFENDPVFATAPAQTVRVTQQLDSDLDFRTFRVGDFGFGDTFIDVPDNRAFYQTRVDLTAAQGIYVDVVAGIDVTKGEAFWEFTSIDPATGEIPADPLRGFLLPNLTPPEGDGFVSYTVRPKSTLATGATIDAQARIVFDINEPIDTPAIFNTIDAGKPTSVVEALPTTVANTSFLVKWSGNDDTEGSALAGYTIYVSENGGEFTPWLEDTTLTEATYIGQPDSTYAFYSVARDNAGNVEAVPNTPDAITITGIPSAGVLLTQSSGSTDVSEEDDLSTDTYTIALNTVPTGAVNIQVAATDGQTLLSSDGVNFSSTLNLSLTNKNPATIRIRPVDDSTSETSPHSGIITHTITSSADPTYSDTLTPIPNVTVNIADDDALETFNKFVNTAWTGLANGIDPDGNGGASAIGVDAFANIADAVNAASNNDKIKVYDGNYSSNLTISNKTISLESLTSAVNITGTISLNNATLNTKKINFNNTTGSNIVTGSNSTLNVVNAAITNSGRFIDGTINTSLDTITANSSSDWFSAIYSASLTLKNSVLNGTRGIYLSNASAVDVSNNQLTTSYRALEASLNNQDSPFTVSNNTSSANYDWNYAIYGNSSRDVLFKNNTVSGQHGFYINNARSSKIQDNDINTTYRNYEQNSASTAEITGNNFKSSSDWATNITNSSNVNFNNNTVSNSSSGNRFDSTNNLNYNHNSVNSLNRSYESNNTQNEIVDFNSFSSANDWAIANQNTVNHRVTNNTVNGRYGYYSNNSSNNIITGNSFNSAYRSAEINNSSNVTFASNTLNSGDYHLVMQGANFNISSSISNNLSDPVGYNAVYSNSAIQMSLNNNFGNNTLNNITLI